MHLTLRDGLPRYRRRIKRDLLTDTRGLAAVEFAMIAPLMLVLFFGTVEVTSGVAVDRKVSLVAHTLSDLTSQASNVNDTQIANFLAASMAIMTPYPAAPVQATVSQVRIDKTTGNATIVWSKGAKAHGAGDTVTVPDGLKPVLPATSDRYLIWSEVSYLYQPITNYTMTDITLHDQTYTRPRQGQLGCVSYNAVGCPS